MEQKFLEIQNRLRGQVVQTDQFKTDEISLVAGVDLAYWNGEDCEYAVCVIAVIDFHTHKMVEYQSTFDRVEIPYMPGFLAFRELPLFEQTVKKLTKKPDLFIFDGNGVLHPRQMGIATHASFSLDVPTIGVAKTFYRVSDDASYTEPGNTRGDFTDIVHDGVVLGRAVRSRPNVKPIFVSVGNRISLETATQLVMTLVDKDSRIPVPTRLADILTHQRRTSLKSGLN